MRPALFLDRDGVIIEDTGYLDRSEGVVLMAGVAEGIATAAEMGVNVVVVSNQSGVGRGYFGWPSVIAVDDAMATALYGADPRAELDLTLYAGAGPQGSGPADPYRKPAPGMIQTAMRLLPINPAASLLIGDRQSDIAAAAAANLGGAILVEKVPTGVTLPHIPARDPCEAFHLALKLLRAAMAAS